MTLCDNKSILFLVTNTGSYNDYVPLTKLRLKDTGF